MADLPNDFWSGWIILITVISFIGLVWLVVSVYTAAPPDPSDVEHTTWDENLKEGISPAPLWWFWLIFAAMVFSVFYLMFYPGLGSFKGAFQWSQGGEYNERRESFEENFQPVRESVVAMNLDEIQADPDLMEHASHVFIANCAACHGYEAQGQANLFPDLRNESWQWGGTAKDIETTLRQGRAGVMNGWQALLGDEGVENVANYVTVLGTQAAEGHPGQAQYNQVCFACHGMDGAGNPLLGAPSLIDDEWLYGDSIGAIQESIRDGRNGFMPAFEGRLDDFQIKLLVAWLSDGE